MKRYGMVIQLKPEKIEEYKKLHAAVWPEVIAILTKHHIKNYSIFLKDDLLFGYFEYHGDNYEKDMQSIADDETTQRWWDHTIPCQEPLVTRQSHEWWASMQEVFHME
jgi:L-rhamnose mutarotase